MPRACLKCGHENPDDVDFCQQCGEYVRWELSGIRQAVPAPPPAAPPPPAAQPDAPAVAAPPAAPPAPVAPPAAAAPPVEAAPAPPPEVAPPLEADGGAAAPQEPSSGPTSEYASPEQAPEPDSVVVTLRLPEDESATGAEVTARVEAGGATSMIALVRNQSGIVDNYDLHVEGLPDGWWSIVPSTVYLVPYGAPGGEYEQEVTVMLNPPRTTEAVAGTWPIRVVAVSKANGTPAGQATGAVEITPYHELEAEMRPAQATGRRKAAFAIAVRNRANAPVDVQLGAVDPDNVMRFAFQKPRFTVEQGRRNGSAIMVKPPKPAWFGRPVQRRFDITSTVIGSDTGALPKSAVLIQKPWIPFWVLMLVPLLLIAAIAAFLLWPRTSTVPELKGMEIIAAEQALADAGLTLGNQTQKGDDKAKAGTILGQSPEAGKELDEGGAVSIVVATATGRAEVPDVVGKTLEEANALISKAGFSLAPPNPPPAPTDIVASQIPLAGNNEPQTTPITLAFKPAPKDGGPGPGQNGTGTVPTVPTATGEGPANIEVPDVGELPQKEAFAKLTELGLVPKVVEEPSADTPVGELIHQNPEHGTKVKKGSEVVLTYSTGAAELVFDLDDDVFLVGALEGAKPKKLAATEDVEEEAAVNPAGTLVAYRRGTADAGRIYTLNPKDPLSAKPITDGGVDDGRPAFSPDGKTIAFIRAKADGDTDLCFVPSNGGAQSCIEDPDHTVSRPTWAPPDGRVIFVVASDKAEGQSELLRYTTSKGGSPKAVDWFEQGFATNDLHGKQQGEGVLSAAFSPDGKQVAFTANWGKDFVYLIVAPVKSGAIQKPKKFFGVRACEVAWRADGLELAIGQRGADCRGSAQLVRVDPKKPGQQVVLRPGGNPVWTPQPLGLE